MLRKKKIARIWGPRVHVVIYTLCIHPPSFPTSFPGSYISRPPLYREIKGPENEGGRGGRGTEVRWEKSSPIPLTALCFTHPNPFSVRTDPRWRTRSRRSQSPKYKAPASRVDVTVTVTARTLSLRIIRRWRYAFPSGTVFTWCYGAPNDSKVAFQLQTGRRSRERARRELPPPRRKSKSCMPRSPQARGGSSAQAWGPTADETKTHQWRKEEESSARIWQVRDFRCASGKYTTQLKQRWLLRCA